MQTSDFSKYIRSRARSLSMATDSRVDNYARTRFSQGFLVCPKTLLLIRSKGMSAYRQKMNWLQSCMHCLAIIT